MTITQKKRCSKIFLVTPKRRTYGKSRNTFLRPHPVTGTVWIYIYGIKLPYPAFLCKFLHHKSYFRRCGPVLLLFLKAIRSTSYGIPSCGSAVHTHRKL